MKIKLSFSLILLVMMSMSVFAQSEYSRSVGLRFGSGYYDWVAASYKTFISQPAALEFNVGFSSTSTALLGTDWGWTTLSLSAAYQHHFPISKVDGLKWFIGGGASLYNSFSDWDGYKGVGVGIFPTGGADYKFAKIPLNVTADVRPTVYIDNLDQNGSFFPSFGASARYTF